MVVEVLSEKESVEESELEDSDPLELEPEEPYCLELLDPEVCDEDTVDSILAKDPCPVPKVPLKLALVL